MNKINLEDKLASFTEHWSPKIIAQLNNYDIMVVKVENEFVWHKHDNTDDFFYVLKGSLDIELRDQVISLEPGELFVVPCGVEHRPIARSGEVHLLLIEPQGTPNTGDVTTATKKERI
ncbi:MAG TPA: cupin domain-containing protein [Acidobacteriaceae bacterium]